MTNPEHLKLKASFMIALTFAVGAITGAALNGMYLQASGGVRAGRGGAPMVENLRRELNLTDDQTVAVRGAIAETRSELRELLAEQCPGIPEAQRRLLERVRPLLTPQQQQRLTTIVGGRQMRGGL
jgi:hypothetical protein